MFAVPNSASVYLINRKGEVVHEWKGNYGVLARAYLQDDGSLIQNAVDPDFPVFAGGGEAGRIQKITWDSKIVWDFEYANEEYLIIMILQLCLTDIFLLLHGKRKQPMKCWQQAENRIDT